MKFALRAPILKYTLFGMLFLNSPAQASEPRSERMEKTAAEVIAADSAAIPKGWDNDCRASYKAGYEAGYRAADSDATPQFRAGVSHPLRRRINRPDPRHDRFRASFHAPHRRGVPP